MISETLINIAKIIEQDSKTSTYKFALLRGTIDIIQDYSPFKRVDRGRVYFPMGLLINKWIFYYYPLLSSQTVIPQINSPKGLAFRNELSAVIKRYEKNGGGMSVLYNDLRLGRTGSQDKVPIYALYAKLKSVIANMPMKYLGYSVYKKHYGVYQYHSGKFRKTQDFIQGYGEFSLPVGYYEALKLLGSFVSGQDSLLSKWADFSFSSSGNQAKKEEILTHLLAGPITERDIKESKGYYRSLLENSGKITCVWTGDSIRSYDIDHVLPFSVWKNNDLWNLLPSTATVNNKKRDKIPSPRVLDGARDRIFHYWDLFYNHNVSRFRREIENSLLGEAFSTGWQQKALSRLKENADYLIKIRGYEEWYL